MSAYRSLARSHSSFLHSSVPILIADLLRRSKHILNAQVSIRAPCCKKWFDVSLAVSEQTTEFSMAMVQHQAKGVASLPGSGLRPVVVKVWEDRGRWAVPDEAELVTGPGSEHRP